MTLKLICELAGLTCIGAGAIFIAYLEIYARLTGKYLNWDGRWKVNLVPLLAIIISGVSGATACLIAFFMVISMF